MLCLHPFRTLHLLDSCTCLRFDMGLVGMDRFAFDFRNVDLKIQVDIGT